MEIVIKIDDYLYDCVLNGGSVLHPRVDMYIREGIPLPKGHGDLIDSTKLKYKVDEEGRILITSETIVKADKESDTECR